MLSTLLYFFAGKTLASTLVSQRETRREERTKPALSVDSTPTQTSTPTATVGPWGGIVLSYGGQHVA